MADSDATAKPTLKAEVRDFKHTKQDNPFPELTWQKGKLAGEADAVRKYTVERGKEAADWYFRKKRPHQRWCRILRLGAIFLASYAALVPLLDSIFKWRLFDSLWSAVALVLAAMFVAIDRFYGFTTGWIRFILAGQQLIQALELFQFDCERERLSWNQPEPTREQVVAFLNLCRSFLAGVHRIVSDETKTWAAEFGEVIRQLDEQIKAANQAAQRSAIHVTVSNGTNFPDGWTIAVGGRTLERRSGKEATVEVVAGLHVIRVEGVKDGKSLRAEKGVAVRSGEIADVTVDLA